MSSALGSNISIFLFYFSNCFIFRLSIDVCSACVSYLLTRDIIWMCDARVPVPELTTNYSHNTRVFFINIVFALCSYVMISLLYSFVHYKFASCVNISSQISNIKRKYVCIARHTHTLSHVQCFCFVWYEVRVCLWNSKMKQIQTFGAR